MTEQQNELLCVLAEEGGEVVQDIMKIFRFGPDDHHPTTNETNRERLTTEIGDFLAVVERLQATGFVSYHGIQKAIKKKHEKLDKWLRN